MYKYYFKYFHQWLKVTSKKLRDEDDDEAVFKYFMDDRGYIY